GVVTENFRNRMRELVDAALEPFRVFGCTANERSEFLNCFLQGFVEREETLQAIALSEKVFLFGARRGCKLLVDGVKLRLGVVDLRSDSGGGLREILLLCGLAVVCRR